MDFSARKKSVRTPLGIISGHNTYLTIIVCISNLTYSRSVGDRILNVMSCLTKSSAKMKTMFGLEVWGRAGCKTAANATRTHSDNRVTSMNPQRVGGCDVDRASDCDEVLANVFRYWTRWMRSVFPNGRWRWSE